MTDLVDVGVLNAEETRPLLESMAALYASDFIDGAADEEFYGSDRYFERMEMYFKLPTFQCVVARADSDLVGYLYGGALLAETSWWTSSIHKFDKDFVREDGERTCALFDMLVARTHRGRGIASRMHREFLDGRGEDRLTLLSSPPQQPAYSMWLGWGYQVIGKSQPDPEGPILDIFLRDRA